MKLITQYVLRFPRLSFLYGLSLCLILSGCGDITKHDKLDLNEVATNEEIAQHAIRSSGSDAEYLFGFDLRNGPREDARQYLPLLDYLSRQTGYPFRLHFSKNAKDLLSELSSGHLQFAAIGAGTYLTAAGNTAISPLVRGVNEKGELGYRSIIVVAPESRLQSLRDLQGRRIAFGSHTSTQGHWIPRIMFDNAGMTLNDFSGHVFTGSHLGCAEAVISGEADACGLQDTLANRLIESGSVRALAKSEIFPSSGIFVSAEVPTEVQQAVVSALVNFDPQGRDRAGLYHWERTEMAGGFAPASAELYSDLRSQALSLGLLPQSQASGGTQ
jgi:phosphonate transport system substrate-binding protein